jgi:enoyl-CoA hydratase/carnithine racemase
VSDRVLRHDSDGLCTLTLNRPEKLNALDVQTFQALNVHVQDLEQQTDRVGCVVLRGEGRAFCAGMDLRVVGQEDDPHDFKPGVIDRLARLPQPVIVAVQGACYTGGLELALTGDFIVADASARFADTHGKWGLVATWGLFQRLPRRIGPGPAKRMMMTSRVVDAAEAKEIGLADLLAPEGELEASTRNLAAEILANSWHVNFVAKRLMRETDGMNLDDGLNFERANYPGLAADHRDRIDRFNKR